MGKSYYRVMLGRDSAYAEECFAGNFIGANFDIRALAVIPTIQFFRYQVSFKLIQA